MAGTLARRLVAAFAAAAVVGSPAAHASPDSPSYEQGKHAVDDAARQGPLQHITDTAEYCNILLRFELKSGQIARVDSPPDFIAGCQDEVGAVLASQ